jgi:RimJ/RimL family protein N-acetyltransferase
MIHTARELAPEQDAALAQRLMPKAAAGFLRLLATGEFDRDALFVSFSSDGHMNGGIVTIDLHGSQVEVWPPTADDDATAEALVIHAVITWRCRGARVFQSVVLPQHAGCLSALARAGFRAITSLAFLERAITEADRSTTAATLSVRAIARDDASFAALLALTYQGGQDVPELNGTRSGDEILAGYRAALAHDPPLWFAVQQHETDIGIIILNPLKGHDLELSYMGLTPPWRGRGLGHALGALAVHLAAELDATRLTLAADVRNRAAHRVYLQLGFQVVDERAVWLLI